MISPQLHPDSSSSRPPATLGSPFNDPMEQVTQTGDGRHLTVVAGSDMADGRPSGAVVNGLWHCLLGGLAAGLGVSAALGALVLMLSYLG